LIDLEDQVVDGAAADIRRACISLGGELVQNRARIGISPSPRTTLSALWRIFAMQSVAE
jgi:hypothetical protein